MNPFEAVGRELVEQLMGRSELAETRTWSVCPLCWEQLPPKGSHRPNCPMRAALNARRQELKPQRKRRGVR